MTDDIRKYIRLVENTLMELQRPAQEEAAIILTNAGYEKIGSGYYADVYHRVGDRWVLKLVATRDHAYKKFVDFCGRYESPHLPIFRGKFMRVTSDYAAIRMEKLSPLPPGPKIEKDIYYMALNLRYYNGEYSMLPDNARIWGANHPELRDVLQALGRELGECCDDICKQNVMFRDDTYVLIDPVG
jgi:hypothetical protein